MKRISLEELEKKIDAESYGQLCAYIYAQIENNSLKPVKASNTNGKKPALYREYWVVEQQEDYSFYEEELQYHMCTEICADYYMRHMVQYRKDRVWVLKLNDYLLQNQKTDALVSMNERSFEIWGREKFLQLEQGRKILKRCGIDTSRLSFYETSEPLAYYSHHRDTPQNLLILENKDTFYSMRRHLLNGGQRVFGIPFGTLIYGAGKGILRSFQDFAFCVEPYMQAPENRIYYFGDLDYEGIGIYERLAEFCLAQHHIQIMPFANAYERMLAKASIIQIEELPMSKEKQNRNITGQFFAWHRQEMVEQMRRILESGRYIPQEILNINDFEVHDAV